MSWERLKLWVLTRLLWRGKPERLLGSLQAFSTTESGAAWQILQGLQVAPDAAVRADLFLQYLEEREHADKFAALYTRVAGRKMPARLDRRRALYSTPADAWKLIVFCKIGEKAAAERFYNLAQVLPEGPVRETLLDIALEEFGHIEKAQDLHRGLPVTVQEVRRETRLIRWTRFSEAWMRAGRNVVAVIAKPIVWIFYGTLGALGSLVRRSV